MTETFPRQPSRARVAAVLILSFAVFAALFSLGTWQVRRLAWKENLIQTIDSRIAGPPEPLEAIERRFSETADVDYTPATAAGTFRHEAERHFFATFEGASGFFVYTPLILDDDRALFVNRGFVPYDRKEPASRLEGEIAGTVTVTGLARNPVTEKPSWVLPDNTADRNIFYWKDLSAMAATANLPPGTIVLPFTLDADRAPNPGGLPVGGVTVVSLPNNHLQYAVTWYGLAAALLGVLAAWGWRARRPLS